MSSSSSSSSYLDYSDDKTIPFIFEIDNINPVWSMAIYGDYIFAGTGPNGVVLRSKDRYFWEEIYSIDDINVKSVYVQNNTLFIGTSPNGKIYVANLNNNSISLSQEIGNEVFGFIYYKNVMYAAGGIPNQIWTYNESKNRWDSVYQPHASIVKKMLVNDKLYLITNSENIISFDGTDWKLETTSEDNVVSTRRVSKEPYSHVSKNFITRSVSQKSVLSEIYDDEDIYDIYPKNYSYLNSADVDGNSLVLGSYNFSKIYNFIDNKLYPIFETDSLNTVNYLLNLDVGVNLASVDNKLYLVYSSDLTSTTSTTTFTTTTSTTTPVLSLLFPSGGEILIVGTIITIIWSSITSINDAVKIELFKNDVLNLTINPNTSNDGTYDWNIPPSLLPGIDYKIKVTWLNSSTQTTEVSSGNFTILYTALPTTTTTTTTTLNVNTPIVKNCRGIPIVELSKDEYITYMIKDVSRGGILFSTSQGRIFGCSNCTVNAYMTGKRDVYAEVKDGFGNISDTSWTTFFYALYNKIAEVNEQKEIVKYKYEKEATAILNERITGIFLSPILSVKEDLSFWKDLIWKENKPDNTEIIICVRAADSVDILQKTSWDYCFISNDSDVDEFVTRNLNTYQIKGKYLQYKVTMTTDSKNVTPSILNIAVTYSTKYATYFYTTKFTLQNQSNVKSGLFVANMTEPKNTEIKFGIAGTNTSDWNDYSVVEMNKLFSLGNLERIKIGIKMVSYDENVPEISEFSLLTGSEKDNKLNEG